MLIILGLHPGKWPNLKFRSKLGYFANTYIYMYVCVVCPVQRFVIELLELVLVYPWNYCAIISIEQCHMLYMYVVHVPCSGF